MKASRNYLVAAALAGLLSLANAIVALILLPRGSAKISSESNQPPYAVILIEVVIGLVGVVAAYGVVRLQRWAVILTLLLMAVNVLISLPGMAFGPTTSDKVTSGLAAVVAGVAIYFLLRRDGRRDSRRASRTPVATEPAEANV